MWCKYVTYPELPRLVPHIVRIYENGVHRRSDFLYSRGKRYIQNQYLIPPYFVSKNSDTSIGLYSSEFYIFMCGRHTWFFIVCERCWTKNLGSWGTPMKLKNIRLAVCTRVQAPTSRKSNVHYIWSFPDFHSYKHTQWGVNKGKLFQEVCSMKIIWRIVRMVRTCRIEEIPSVFACGLTERCIGHGSDT
jgi:hypothetical protein